jgi:hypothetical protein
LPAEAGISRRSSLQIDELDEEIHDIIADLLHYRSVRVPVREPHIHWLVILQHISLIDQGAETVAGRETMNSLVVVQFLATLMGPFSVKRPNIEEDLGPPFNQRIRGAVLLVFLNNQ